MKLFEVYLSPLSAKQFLALATHSAAGDGQAESDLPFWEGEHDWRTTLIKTLEIADGFRSDYFPRPGEQDWLQQAGILAPDGQSFHPAYLCRIGRMLYDSLFPANSSLRQAFQTALRLAEQGNDELHLRLKFAADSSQRSRLADYPWELIHNGQHFLQHRQVVLSRYIAYEALPPQLESRQQIKVLLIASRANDAALGLGQLSGAEQQAIRRGLAKAEASGDIALEQLASPTHRALRTYLTEQPSAQMPQVLHFDGHGLFGKQCVNPNCRRIYAGIKAEICQNCGQILPEPQGFLVFETEQGEADYVSATVLAALLPMGISLVVLSACQSGMAVAGDSMFNGTAQKLIDSRVPAVVAMQYKVTVDAAVQFAEQFYRVLGQKRPLSVALHEGRRWMDVESNQWYRPVLYLRWQDNEGGQLFASESPPEPASTVLKQPTNKMPLSTSRKGFYERQIARLQEELAAIESDLASAPREVDRLKLERAAEQLLNKIHVLEAKLG